MSREPQELRVTVDDGVALQVARWTADRADAPAVLLMHGLTANRLGALPLVEALAGEAEVVAFDCRGRGRSDKPADPAAYGHRRHADDAAEVLRQLGLGHPGRGSVVAVGQSMGAWQVLQLAAHHPELVRALVLLDGGWFADLPAGTAPAQVMADVMGEGWDARLDLVFPSADAVIGAFRAHPAFQGWWSDDLERHLREGLEELPDGTARSRAFRAGVVADCEDYFHPRGQRPAVRADLARVQVPVTLVRATSGFLVSPTSMAPLVPEEACAGFARELPQLRVVTVEGTNHYSVNYGPEGTAAAAAAVREALAEAAA